MSANDTGFIAALEEAKKGYEEGGIPSTRLIRFSCRFQKYSSSTVTPSCIWS